MPRLQKYYDPLPIRDASWATSGRWRRRRFLYSWMPSRLPITEMGMSDMLEKEHIRRWWRRLRKLNQRYNLLLVRRGFCVLTARVNNWYQAYIATSDHVVKNRKASANEQQQNQFYWMDTFYRFSDRIYYCKRRFILVNVWFCIFLSCMFDFSYTISQKSLTGRMHFNNIFTQGQFQGFPATLDCGNGLVQS